MKNKNKKEQRRREERETGRPSEIRHDKAHTEEEKQIKKKEHRRE